MDTSRYYISILCALPVELEAMKACCDDFYTPASTTKLDTSQYTFARIGRHAVILASLHLYGNISSSVASSRIKRRFPNVQFCMLVGIGGGVPCGHARDMHLGDIAVSIPGNGTSGFLNYDSGKNLNSQGIIIKSHMNKPPQVLIDTALALGHGFRPWLEELITEYLASHTLSKLFRPQSRDTDILYTSECCHPSSEASRPCSEICIGGALVDRPARTTQAPCIFHGTIATGNTVMKDALKRDALAQAERIICFDMESAGREAMEACLDDVYHSKQKLPNDPMIYTLGRIGKHAVVITSLSSSYGNSQSAAAAVNIRRSFPNIRTCLMVGIGGGVPYSNGKDIHLGDVVVSFPTGGHSGILSYDCGKDVEGVGFQVSAYGDSPPQSLLLAVHQLRDGSWPKLTAMADDILARGALKESFRFPGRDADVLFEPSAVHVSSPAAAGDCHVSCTHLPKRQREPRENDHPVVFHGLVASGNGVIKNAVRCQELAKKYGILCFEMEAAGVSKSLDCLSIRGICDYSDSHKMKHWQKYAALVAACYAKELLLWLSVIELAKHLKGSFNLDNIDNIDQPLLELLDLLERQSEKPWTLVVDDVRNLQDIISVLDQQNKIAPIIHRRVVLLSEDVSEPQSQFPIKRVQLQCLWGKQGRLLLQNVLNDASLYETDELCNTLVDMMDATPAYLVQCAAYMTEYWMPISSFIETLETTAQKHGEAEFAATCNVPEHLVNLYSLILCNINGDASERELFRSLLFHSSKSIPIGLSGANHAHVNIFINKLARYKLVQRTRDQTIEMDDLFRRFSLGHARMALTHDWATENVIKATPRAGTADAHRLIYHGLTMAHCASISADKRLAVLARIRDIAVRADAYKEIIFIADTMRALYNASAECKGTFYREACDAELDMAVACYKTGRYELAQHVVDQLGPRLSLRDAKLRRLKQHLNAVSSSMGRTQGHADVEAYVPFDFPTERSQSESADSWAGLLGRLGKVTEWAI
ncbi:hypothetical protein TD95_000988 [Thielaviopsis punctulata]|uniref:Nucleoside phosphorylase domain-containing protein n=1 Tax=Thielaviopsis punctulata TaxID=72032 RepID=A0A0F4ZC87_9PEZI|nr:hypothetical protein TD95_000988 [Thielaviopsis punctulata]